MWKSKDISGYLGISFGIFDGILQGEIKEIFLGYHWQMSGFLRISWRYLGDVMGYQWGI